MFKMAMSSLLVVSSLNAVSSVLLQVYAVVVLLKRAAPARGRKRSVPFRESLRGSFASETMQ